MTSERKINKSERISYDDIKEAFSFNISLKLFFALDSRSAAHARNSDFHFFSDTSNFSKRESFLNTAFTSLQEVQYDI